MARRLEGIVVGVAAVKAGSKTRDLVLILCPWHEVGHKVHAIKLRLIVTMKDRAAAMGAMEEWIRL